PVPYDSVYTQTLRRPPISSLFPYTTLFRSALRGSGRGGDQLVPDRHLGGDRPDPGGGTQSRGSRRRSLGPLGEGRRRSRGLGRGDRKSTRLNSSHVKISYAVFCLKKKKA